MIWRITDGNMKRVMSNDAGHYREKLSAEARGDLTKWLIEIDTGVFVGNLSARVRDSLWERVCANIKTGTAAMAYGVNNEQKLDFRVHNSAWEPVDFDGIKLVRRTLDTADVKYKAHSRVSANHLARLSSKKEENFSAS